jgi:hypothetical protein
VKLSASLIVYERLNSLTDGFLEAWVLEEYKTLRQLRLASTDVIIRHVTDQEESEDRLEELYVFIGQIRDKLA